MLISTKPVQLRILSANIPYGLRMLTLEGAITGTYPCPLQFTTPFLNSIILIFTIIIGEIVENKSYYQVRK